MRNGCDWPWKRIMANGPKNPTSQSSLLNTPVRLRLRLFENAAYEIGYLFRLQDWLKLMTLCFGELNCIGDEAAAIKTSPSCIASTISTRNRAQYLRQTLDSLSQIRRDSLEVELIVIDNASRDKTMGVATEAARRLPFRVHLLSFSRGGKAAALNYALPIATGKYLAFTDDDLRFDAPWLLKLLAPLRAGQADAVVGEVRLAPHLTRSWMEPTHRAMLAEVRPNNERHQLVGANMALSRECLDWVGGFDPALGPGALGLSEEVLLECQIRARGGRIRFVEGAVVEHHFDPRRLERPSWIRYAKASGRSNAYIFHHWDRGSVPLLALRRAKRTIQLGFCALSGWRRRKAGSPIDSHEIELIRRLAFLSQFGIQRKTNPKYSTPS
jgi:glycosyltransferase involved in cell wall biosynthesis